MRSRGSPEASPPGPLPMMQHAVWSCSNPFDVMLALGDPFTPLVLALPLPPARAAKCLRGDHRWCSDCSGCSGCRQIPETTQGAQLVGLHTALESAILVSLVVDRSTPCMRRCVTKAIEKYFWAQHEIFRGTPPTESRTYNWGITSRILPDPAQGPRSTSLATISPSSWQWADFIQADFIQACPVLGQLHVPGTQGRRSAVNRHPPVLRAAT